MQVRVRSLGVIRCWVKRRKAIGGLSGPRGSSEALRVCPALWHWAVSDASARARLEPD